ncbi:MAG: hypothetical protein LAT65_20335 [Saccharospirillum sp.]|nr:hypothetical protein [Saccharospirillum sp.]
MDGQHKEMREAEDHRLDAVFSVMVTGHRKKRLQRLAAIGKDEHLNRLLGALLDDLAHRSRKLFEQFPEIYRPSSHEPRLLTGVASGADELAAATAREHGYSLHMIAPGRAADADFEEPQPERAIALGMRPTGKGQRGLRQSDYSFRDRLAMSFADLLIAIWDGQESFPMTSGTSLCLKESLLRRNPVIWIRPTQPDQPPELLVCDPARLTDSALAELEVLGATPTMVKKLFIQTEMDSPDYQRLMSAWLYGLLAPFADSLNDNNQERKLRQRISRQSTSLGYCKDWLTWWSPLPRHRSCQRPLPLLTWLSGAMLWFQVMINPPRTSASLQILEYLTSEPRPLSWREHMVSRLHGFFSGLIKLTWTGAIKALRQQPVIEPAEEPSLEPVNSPIKAGRITQWFQWADNQARLSALRYRDDTWIVYYAAALAVFCAVAGATYLWPANQPGFSMIWVILEFVLLRFVVGKVLAARFMGWHARWMSLRYIAEHLRMLRIGFPLLVLPRSMHQPIWEPNQQEEQQPIRLTHPEAWILQRVLIAEGLPQSTANKAYFRITHHNEAILQGLNEGLSVNREYYQHLYHQLHRDHHHLHRFSLILFGLTFLAVLSHFVTHLPGILFFTAFLPAWGAAIHGILNQNEVTRVSAMAASTWQRLNTLSTALEWHKTINDSDIDINDHARAWARTQEIRGVCRALVDVLDEENKQWVALLQHNHPELPG